MSSVQLYTLILSFASGIFLRSFFEISWPVCLWAIVVAFGLLGIGRRKNNIATAGYTIVVGIALVGFGSGMMRLALVYDLAPPAPLANQVGEPVSLVGQVVTEPDVRAGSTNLTVRVGQEKILVQTDRHSRVQYGDTVSLVGKISFPKPFVTDLGREFDYPEYLKAKGINYTMAFGSITVTDATTGNLLLKRLFVWKQQFMHALELVIPEPEVGLGEGLILGTKQALGADIETAFRRSGIIHIVVLSGYNILIIVEFVMLVLSFVLPQRARIVVGMVVIIIFALLVGAGASVVRASIMSGLGLLALALGRQYAIMRALFCAGAIMLFVNPLLLVHDVGFQLSFMATLGLVLVAPYLEGVLVGVSTRYGIKEFLIATLATQIAVLPILLYHIGQFSVIAVVVNVLVLPVVSLAMLGTFLTGSAALFSTSLALPFAYVTYCLLTYIITIATRFAALPFAAFDVPPFPFLLVPIMYAGMGFVWYRWLLRSRECVPLTVPSLEGWQIEEEIDGTLIGISSSKNGQGDIPSPSDERLPIFFR